jgi:hypothetical protein
MQPIAWPGTTALTMTMVTADGLSAWQQHVRRDRTMRKWTETSNEVGTASIHL